MVDLVITATSVVAGTDVVTTDDTAGEAITAGKAVYFNTTTRRWMLADSNSATVEARKAAGIALHAASTGQPIRVQTKGPITIGATLTPGVAYYLSDTPGGICPVADIGTGEYVCLLGFATSATVLDINIQFPNVAL